MSDFSQTLCTAWLRPDGRKGIRNKLLIIHTVDCSAHVAFAAAQALRREGCDTEVIGQRSCYDHQTRIRALLGYCVHPNIGAVLVIGHGCESTSAEKISAFASANGRPSAWLLQIREGGTAAALDRALALGRELRAEMERQKRDEPFSFADLILSGKCGGSDFTSGLAGNTLTGSVFDAVVDAGGTCMFAEMNEGLGLRDFFTSRGATKEAGEALGALYDKAERTCRLGGRFFISPGNMAGGLSTIEEKSMGASAKSGSRPIQGVLKIGQQPPRKGLWAFDELTDDISPHRLPEEGNRGGDCAVMMLMGASGCQVSLLITGRGHVCGIGPSPTIKITGNPRTYAAMKEDIDFDASRLLTGKRSMEELTRELLERIAAVCAGELTLAEQLGHRENEMWSVSQDAPSCRA